MQVREQMQTGRSFTQMVVTLLCSLLLCAVSCSRIQRGGPGAAGIHEESESSAKELQGKWVSEEDEDEFVGRYVYHFREDGLLDLYKYETKDSANAVSSETCGMFVTSNDVVRIVWRTKGELLQITYKLLVRPDGPILVDQKSGDKLIFRKEKQCF